MDGASKRPYTIRGAERFASSRFARLAGSERKGFGLEDCDPIQGDYLQKAVTWNDNAKISESFPVRLKIRLQNADLYALQFVDQVKELPNQVTHLNGLSLPVKP